jgi:opacity protein-like surface antigen
MSIRHWGTIAILGFGLAGSFAGGVGAQPTTMAQGYDVNPSPLAAIGPSLREDLPLPRLRDTPTVTADQKSAPTTDSSAEGGQILYDVDTRSRFTPYLGLGGPTARLDRVRNPSAAPSTGDPVQGYQGVAGLAYNLDSNVQFNLGYRYSNFHRQDTPVPEDTEVDSQSHDGRAMLLFKYELGGGNR